MLEQYCKATDDTGNVQDEQTKEQERAQGRSTEGR